MKIGDGVLHNHVRHCSIRPTSIAASTEAWYGMVWCLFIQHQGTSYIAQITQDAEREMREV